jgi:hypothetical protein
MGSRPFNCCAPQGRHVQLQLQVCPAAVGAAAHSQKLMVAFAFALCELAAGLLVRDAWCRRNCVGDSSGSPEQFFHSVLPCCPLQVPLIPVPALLLGLGALGFALCAGVAVRWTPPAAQATPAAPAAAAAASQGRVWKAVMEPAPPSAPGPGEQPPAARCAAEPSPAASCMRPDEVMGCNPSCNSANWACVPRRHVCAAARTKLAHMVAVEEAGRQAQALALAHALQARVVWHLNIG